MRRISINLQPNEVSVSKMYLITNDCFYKTLPYSLTLHRNHIIRATGCCFHPHVPLLNLSLCFHSLAIWPRHIAMWNQRCYFFFFESVFHFHRHFPHFICFYAHIILTVLQLPVMTVSDYRFLIHYTPLYFTLLLCHA